MNIFEAFLLERVERFLGERIHIGPNAQRIKIALERSSYRELSWIVTPDNFYLWDGVDLLHAYVWEFVKSYEGEVNQPSNSIQGRIRIPGYGMVEGVDPEIQILRPDEEGWSKDKGTIADLRRVNRKAHQALDRTGYRWAT